MEGLALTVAGQAAAGEDLTGLYGFGGLHGGAVAALLLAQMQPTVAPDFRPVEITTHYLSPVTEPPAVRVEVLREGVRTTQVRAIATVGDNPVATAEAVFSRAQTRPADSARALPVLTPTLPSGITAIDDSQPFAVPAEFMPLARLLEIRPATPTLPFSGADEAALCAWIRLLDPGHGPGSDRHPTRGPRIRPLARLLILVDSLAPSYAALLRGLTPVPTVRMTVHFSPEAHRDASTGDDGWVLVRGNTGQAGADRWLTESLDVWTSSGTHLASATQLRTVR